MSNRFAATQPAYPHDSSDRLLELFLNQLSWILGGAQDAKRVFTAWLLASPPPPVGPAAVLAQARRLTGRHLVQLDQLLEGLSVPLDDANQNPAIRALLQEGDACLCPGNHDSARFAVLLSVVQRISACFGTACASAAETAMVLGRVDLAAVLASWAAAWRELQRTLAPVSAAPFPSLQEARTGERLSS